jgi:hypothetical protein
MGCATPVLIQRDDTNVGYITDDTGLAAGSPVALLCVFAAVCFAAIGWFL